MKIYAWREIKPNGVYNIIKQFKEDEFTSLSFDEFEKEGIEGVFTCSDTATMNRMHSNVIAVKRSHEKKIRWV